MDIGSATFPGIEQISFGRAADLNCSNNPAAIRADRVGGVKTCVARKHRSVEFIQLPQSVISRPKDRDVNVVADAGVAYNALAIGRDITEIKPAIHFSGFHPLQPEPVAPIKRARGAVRVVLATDNETAIRSDGI